MKAFLWDGGVSLHRLFPDDGHVHKMANWLNDDDVTRLLFAGFLPADPTAIREEWERNLQNPREIVFAVHAGSTGLEFVGTAGLYSINWVHRTAEYRIFLGDKTCWGQGYGTDATKAILRYAFGKLNLYSVWLGVNIENRAAVRVYEKVGFFHEGILRQIYYRNGRRYDIKRMSILREEWDDL